jgi:UDP-N-acetylglucosamine--N-acetylmuramyl-(pentapeptide) pyrophosphoryl-undecaprenol N-acetylglucosamine transferase
MVVSRAGANAICELLALHKPNLLIPLSAAASRGDQILNANSFAKQGFSAVLEEEALTDEALLSGILDVYRNRSQYIHAMESSSQSDAVEIICNLLDEACRK